MIDGKIQHVLSRLEKDIDYETEHLDEIPSEKRLNCISKKHRDVLQHFVKINKRQKHS